MTKQDMFAASARQKSPGGGQWSVFVFQSSKGIVATVPRIDVQGKNTARLTRDNGEIPGPITKPSLDHIVVDAGIPESLRHQVPNRVLGGRTAIGPTTGAGHPVLMLNRVMQGQDRKAKPRIVHRAIDDSLRHF
jgi:hypothetical protein